MLFLTGAELRKAFRRDQRDLIGKEILLEPGQIVVLLTDGITESVARGGEEFGARGALDHIATHHGESARQIAGGLHLETRRFAAHAPQHDITSVVLKVNTPI